MFLGQGRSDRSSKAFKLQQRLLENKLGENLVFEKYEITVKKVIEVKSYGPHAHLLAGRSAIHDSKHTVKLEHANNTVIQISDSEVGSVLVPELVGRLFAMQLRS
jgi:hypothetical protein